MQLIQAQSIGFCFGVRRAIDMAEGILKERGSLYILGELIHNASVIRRLEALGAVTVNSIEEVPTGETVLIRSHGVPPKVIKDCAARSLNVKNATCPFVEKIHYDIEEVQVYFFSGRTRRKVAEILEGYPDFSSAFGSKYVEIFAKNTSKGTALNALASRLGIAKEEIACIGDSANDLPMYEAAGLKIAMGNAVQELKKKADIVAYSNHIDGAAKVIEQYIL